MPYLVSPTEPPTIARIGKVSSLPEKFGCDLLCNSRGRWIGVQRKEIKDFIRSAQDGRLTKEVAQMSRCERALLVLEGPVHWTSDGWYINPRIKWSMAQHLGLLWSLQDRGVWYSASRDMNDTVVVAEMFRRWADKTEHLSLDKRPGVDSPWGKPGHVEYMRHLVMGLPDVGPKQAALIVEKFGLPFGWKIGVDELMTIPGIGRKKAEKMFKALGGVDG